MGRKQQPLPTLTDSPLFAKSLRKCLMELQRVESLAAEKPQAGAPLACLV